MAIAEVVGGYVAAEEDAVRCYLQLASWADHGCRHRTTKYFYKWAGKHFERIEVAAKLANDLSAMPDYEGSFAGVAYGAMPAVASKGANTDESDMLDWFDQAYKLEQKLLKKIESVVAAADEENATSVIDLFDDLAAKTVRQIAHLYRKTEMLEEAKGDVAALQSFDHRL